MPFAPRRWPDLGPEADPRGSSGAGCDDLDLGRQTSAVATPGSIAGRFGRAPTRVPVVSATVTEHQVMTMSDTRHRSMTPSGQRDRRAGVQVCRCAGAGAAPRNPTFRFGPGDKALDDDFESDQEPDAFPALVHSERHTHRVSRRRLSARTPTPPPFGVLPFPIPVAAWSRYPATRRSAERTSGPGASRTPGGQMPAFGPGGGPTRSRP
jgi:hypothetical protein